MNKVLLVSDDAHGGRRLSAAWPNPSEVFWAHDLSETFFHLLAGNVAVVVVDETASNGKAVALLEEIACAYPHTVRVFMTSQLDLAGAVHLTNKVGLFRLLAKPASTDDFILAVNAALAAAAARRVTNQVNHLGEFQDQKGHAPAVHGFLQGPAQAIGVDHLSRSYDETKLSRREKEILLAVVQGKKPVEIARAFFISVHTARNHIKALYRKFDVHSQVELIARVLHTPGIVELSAGSRRVG